MTLEDLVELILEILFEVPFEAAMESKKLKTGVKTTLFSILGGGITLFFGFLAVISWLDQDFTAAFFLAVLTAIFLIFVIYGAIRGHKRKWKNP